MYKLEDIQNLNHPMNSVKVEINGKWVSCRGENYKHRTFIKKVKESWDVFTGKADCFTWPEDQ